jgi:hypothetical protein
MNIEFFSRWIAPFLLVTSISCNGPKSTSDGSEVLAAAGTPGVSILLSLTQKGITYPPTNPPTFTDMTRFEIRSNGALVRTYKKDINARGRADSTEVLAVLKPAILAKLHAMIEAIPADANVEKVELTHQEPVACFGGEAQEELNITKQFSVISLAAGGCGLKWSAVLTEKIQPSGVIDLNDMGLKAKGFLNLIDKLEYIRNL